MYTQTVENTVATVSLHDNMCINNTNVNCRLLVCKDLEMICSLISCSMKTVNTHNFWRS